MASRTSLGTTDTTILGLGDACSGGNVTLDGGGGRKMQTLLPLPFFPLPCFLQQKLNNLYTPHGLQQRMLMTSPMPLHLIKLYCLCQTAN